MNSRAVSSLYVSHEDDDIFYSSADSRKSSTSSFTGGLFSGSSRSSSDQPWEKEFDIFIQQTRQSTTCCTTANQSTTVPDRKHSKQATKNLESRGNRLSRSFSESSGVGQNPASQRSRSPSTGTRPSRTFTSRPLCIIAQAAVPHDSLSAVTRAPSRAAEILRQFSLCWS